MWRGAAVRARLTQRSTSSHRAELNVSSGWRWRHLQTLGRLGRLRQTGTETSAPDGTNLWLIDDDGALASPSRCQAYGGTAGAFQQAQGLWSRQSADGGVSVHLCMAVNLRFAWSTQKHAARCLGYVQAPQGRPPLPSSPAEVLEMAKRYHDRLEAAQRYVRRADQDVMLQGALKAVTYGGRTYLCSCSSDDVHGG